MDKEKMAHCLDVATNFWCDRFLGVGIRVIPYNDDSYANLELMRIMSAAVVKIATTLYSQEATNE